jgi:glyoxylase-like metal-dependent hydrolase (beta-lactamase superfamily II)
MRHLCLPVGLLGVNCYLVWDETSRAGLVIDPGDEPERIAAVLREQRIEPRGILLTHAHVDHIRGLPALAAALRLPVWVHPADRTLYRSPANALPPWLPAASGLPEPVSEPPIVPGLDYRILPTPGHTPGGVCYHIPAAALLFTGDTLFAGAVGRTDLPGGDAAALLDSIRTRLLSLPPATVVLPGHGPASTVAAEAQGNPYLRDDGWAADRP